jgi:hypothetical protein
MYTLVPFVAKRSIRYTGDVPVKNPAAVAPGKLSAASMTPEQRKENATKAGNIGE